ncbi:MAG: nucleoside phosphorylase [Bacteroidetes bacterium]|nr:nucleoside phosphorylase [Bacteroidota bacterium]
MKYLESELILNPDGSVYHLNLLPEDIGSIIITVGDMDRIDDVVCHFDRIDLRKRKREFATVTEWIGNTRISCISTGIGTDNIDIVLNELDALINIDLKTREEKKDKKVLDIVRIGTSGSIQTDIPIDSILVSEYAIGMDGLLLFYQYAKTNEIAAFEANFKSFIEQHDLQILPPYIAKGDAALVEKFSKFAIKGTTLTHTGFYAPQGRKIRFELAKPAFIEMMSTYRWGEQRITNFEMETAGIYGLGGLLGHRCCAVNAIVANRALGVVAKDMKKTVERAIKSSLEQLL